MTNWDLELYILIGGGAFGIGAVLSAIYYFARFGLRSYEEPPPEEQRRLEIEAVKREEELSRLLGDRDPSTSTAPLPEPISTPTPGSAGLKVAKPPREDSQDASAALQDGRGVPPAPEKQRDTGEVPAVTLRSALSKTRNQFFGRIEKLFSSDKSLKAEEVREGLEEILYTSDLGPKTVSSLLEKLEEELSLTELSQFDRVREEIKAILGQELSVVNADNSSPFEGLMPGMGLNVWMIVGVNGVGKTTTIGKLAHQAASQGLKVMVAAGDTFRAAAQNQLKVWADRAQVEIFSPPGVTDPAAVAFDAVSSAKAKHFDLVLIDTAGRLHTQANLMDELKKVKRVIEKVLPEGTDETLIVLDANSGQNALIQARQFNEAVQLTGAVVTKMDGTSKGGVIVGLASELKIPTRMIGVGERMEDLRPFDSQEFLSAIFS